MNNYNQQPSLNSVLSAEVNTITAALSYRAKSHRDKTVYTFLKNGETPSHSLTFAELERKAKAVAKHLSAQVAPGKCALLLFDPGLDFAVGFFACLYAGVIAVPAFAPRAGKLHYQRLSNIVADAGADAIVSVSHLRDKIEPWKASDAEHASLYHIDVDCIDEHEGEGFCPPAVDENAIAFLQYTSGSTGQPKGVMVSHANLMDNEKVICQAFEHDENNVLVGWLPLYHDMGLIGNLLQPIYLGSSGYLMSPQAFLQEPMRWLKAISDYRATTSGGPNFAYDLCLRSISDEQKAELDLSCWKIAFNGSEVVRAATLEKFSAAFAISGFDGGAFYPCYGMAETTLFTTGSKVGRGALINHFDGDKIKSNQVVAVAKDAENAQALVGSGYRRNECEVSIVCLKSFTRCDDDQIGEIWVSSNSVAQGYWGKPELTEQTFNASIAGEPGKTYLRTGDMGFLRGGELFVTGRIKELVIIRGRNHYPQDIEATIQNACDALVGGGGAAFAVDVDGQERLVVVQEVKRTRLRDLDQQAIFNAARSAVTEMHELRLDDLVLIKPMRLPKTSSGKIRRGHCRDLYLSDDMASLAKIGRMSEGHSTEPSHSDVAQDNPMLHMLQFLPEAEKAKAVAAYLQSKLAQTLRVGTDQIGVDAPISSLGLDSLAAVEFQQQMKQELGIHCPLNQLLEGATLTSLSRQVGTTTEQSAQMTPEIVVCDNDGRYPLAANQQALWYIYQLDRQNPAYNLALPVRINARLNGELLQRALAAVMLMHPSLKNRFVAQSDGHIKQCSDGQVPQLTRIDARLMSHAELKSAAEHHSRLPFDLPNGEVSRLTLFELADDDQLLLFGVHHMVGDLWSMQLLLKDFLRCYRALVDGKTLPQKPKGQYSDFIAWQQLWLASQEGEQAKHYWLEHLSQLPPVLNLPFDHPRKAQPGHQAKVLNFTLTQAQSKALAQLARSQQATLFSTLLSAFQLTMKRFSGQNDFAVGVPSMGRGESAFNDVIGYFVSVMAIRSRFSQQMSLKDCLGQTRKHLLDALAHQHYPLHTLVDEICGQTDPSVNPIYQTWFQLEQPKQLPQAGALILGNDAKLSLEGLSVSPFAIDEPGAKLDLALTMVDLGENLAGRWVYNSELFEPASIAAMQLGFEQVLQHLLADLEQSVSSLCSENQGVMLGEQRALSSVLFHQAFEAQVKKSPERTALVCEPHRLTFDQLNGYANRLANALITQGVASGDRVAVCLPRSADMVALQLAILKAGAAFIPLDPDYPRSRLEYIVKDAAVSLVVCGDDFAGFDGANGIGFSELKACSVDCDDADLELAIDVNELAYLIYTSGSTGEPKGVMISHRNVENFCLGMDIALDEQQAPRDKTWLAVTSSSFDISILELFWTLTRGYQVIVEAEQSFRQGQQSEVASSNIDFSLFYFADDVAAEGQSMYNLLLEGAKFADEHQFSAVWVPERHFHSFGGQFPNPSLAAAAVAATTKRVQIRAGSVVLPLHDPIRVTEEWSMVDNLSGGRVGMSITPGWNPNDFCLSPESFNDRYDVLNQSIDQVKRLWRGESITRLNGVGEQVEVATFPRPVQPELPVWLTAAGHPDTFRTAGLQGRHLLTHLLGQNIKELAEKLDIYRNARAEAGLERDGGHITVMLHSFVTDNDDKAMQLVEKPFKSYLRSSVGLMKPLAEQLGIDFKSQKELLVEQGFDRYATTSALFGTPQTCLKLIDQLKRIGVNEVACLIDFGVDAQVTLDNLKHLNHLRALANPAQGSYTPVNELIERHQVTHLQCTPAYARMLLQQAKQAGKTVKLDKLMVGGEAFPLDLAKALKQQDIAEIYNMYGPTETTIWSAVAKVTKMADGEMHLGTPLVNTGLYVLNDALEPVPYNVEGELYISGEGLARGYWNREDLTKERFIANPFGKGRLYRTSDVVKQQRSGALHYIGRSDDQVKINGFRIELGEIEAVLSTLEGLEQGVVIAEQLATGDSRLKAFVVATELTTSQITTHLHNYLPSYMCPSIIVFVDALPLTPNGKVDRKALKGLKGETGQDEAAIMVAPQTPMQQTLADIWCSLLQLDDISIHGNFFTLGGHSLLATRLVSILNEQHGLNITLQDIFTGPTIAQMAALLEQQQATGEGNGATEQLFSQIVPDNAARFEPFPLTAVQQAYWLGRGDSFELGNISTHVYFEFALKQIDIKQLSQAWQRLIERHDMLRAIFLESGQQQVLEHTPSYDIAISQMTGDDQEQGLLAVREQMSHQVMDTAKWPLFDIRVSRTDERDILHISMDVLIADGLSTVMLFKEWSELYHQPQTELPALEVSFRDCVLAEQKLDDSEQYAKAKAYWMARMDDIPTAPELPLAKSPSALQSPRFVRRSYHLVEDKWLGLQQLAQKRGLTPSGILIAAFAEVLTLWSKNPRFTINLTLFNRLPLHPQIGDLVGDFTSLTLLSVDNSTPAPFAERALGLQQQLWQDLDSRLFNGVEVLRELAKQRGRASAAMPVVFTSALGLGAVEGDGNGIENLGELVYGISQTPQVWLDHQVMEYRGGLLFNWDAVEELFPADMLDAMFGAYVELLNGLAEGQSHWQQAHPGALLPTQQQALLSAVNQTQSPQPSGLLHTLFNEQVTRTPDNVAIISNDKTLSYQQLQQYAIQVAAKLNDAGVAQGDIVAVSMNKGWQQVVAVYAALYAGAAYVPIDPLLPQARIEYLLQQTDAKAVLVQSAMEQQRLWPLTFNIMAIEPLFDGSRTLPLPEAMQRQSDLAYIIFTSGSTGVPKGVMIDHLGAVNTVVDINQRFDVGADDRVFALSSLSFDLSVYDIFGVLATGGAMVIPDHDGIKEPAHWAQMTEQHQVTMWNSVPALMQMFVEYIHGDSRRAGAPLRVALLSGDWLPLKLPSIMRQLWPQILPVSLGGATEASIWSIFHPIVRPEQIKGCIPYGKPLTNQKFYVLNRFMEQTPVWATGELYIAGIGLAQGYWRDEEKTSAAFFNHPKTGERLYRTGDMGRFLSDGNIEFLGREDSQVKINGFRVELGEIERTIQQYPDVKEAIVTTFGEREDKQLAAYYTLNGQSSPEQNGQAWFSEFSEDQLQGVLTDEIERSAFKLHRHGIRQLSDEQAVMSVKPEQQEQSLRSSWLKRQSFRQFADSEVESVHLCGLLGYLNQWATQSAFSMRENPLGLYLWLKEGAVNGLPKGAYRYDPLENVLIELEVSSTVDATWFGPNQTVYQRAGFALFMLGCANDDNWLDAGAISQLLMENSTEHHIGWCPMGRVSDLACQLFGAGQSVVYAMVGGAIEPSQQQSWMSERSPEQALQTFLANRLPAYMVPHSLIALDEVPLTSNGKVDRKALPQPTAAQQTQQAFVAASGGVEQQLASFFAELLKRERISAVENFFDIGGNSLTAAQLNARIREQFDIELPLRAIFEHNSVSALAAQIQMLQQTAANLDVDEDLADDMERMEF